MQYFAQVAEGEQTFTLDITGQFRFSNYAIQEIKHCEKGVLGLRFRRQHSQLTVILYQDFPIGINIVVQVKYETFIANKEKVFEGEIHKCFGTNTATKCTGEVMIQPNVTNFVKEVSSNSPKGLKHSLEVSNSVMNKSDISHQSPKSPTPEVDEMTPNNPPPNPPPPGTTRKRAASVDCESTPQRFKVDEGEVESDSSTYIYTQVMCICQLALNQMLKI